MSEPIVVNRKLIKMINLLDYEKKKKKEHGMGPPWRSSG